MHLAVMMSIVLQVVVTAIDTPPLFIVGEPPTVTIKQNVAQWYELDDGVCLNGDKAGLFAWHGPSDSGANDNWVIQIGGPPELNWCISEAHCAMFATPSAPGTTLLVVGGTVIFQIILQINTDLHCHHSAAQLSHQLATPSFMMGVSVLHWLLQLSGTTCTTNKTMCPTNMTFLGFGGPMSTNCTDNPDFCHFNSGCPPLRRHYMHLALAR